MCRSPMPAAERDDRIAGIGENVGAYQFLSCCHRSLDLVALEHGYLAKRIDPGHETDFRLEDIADTGDYFLVKQHVADFFAAVRGNAINYAGCVEVGAQYIDIGRWNSCVALERLRRVHLGDRHFESDRNEVAVFDHDAHVEPRLLPAFSVAIDVPASVHQHVRG